MTEAAFVTRFEDAYHQLKNSFIRYLVENSEPEVREDFDRRAMALYEDWDRELRQGQTAVADLLAEEDVVPSTSSFPIGFSTFNFLSPGYLLRHVLEKTKAEIEALAAVAKDIEAWPRAAELLKALVRRQEGFVERARKLDADRPKEPAAPPRIKGTSASRW